MKQLALIFIFLLSTSFAFSQKTSSEKNGVYCEGDSLLNNVYVLYYENGCLIRSSQYFYNRLIEKSFFNQRRDTLSIIKYNNGTISMIDWFYFKEREEGCFDSFSETIYYYRILSQEYGAKGKIAQQTFYERKLNKKGTRLEAYPTITEYYHKDKLSYRIKYLYDENMNITYLKEK